MNGEPTVKRLEKSRTHRVIDGICGGVGEYLGIDPVIVRVIFAASLLLGGLGAVIYLALMIIMPAGKARPAGDPSPESAHAQPATEKGRPVKTRALKSAQAELASAQPPPGETETGGTGRTPGSGALVGGILLIALGSVLLLKELGFGIWRFWWGAPWDVALSLILIAAGVAIVVTGKRTTPEEGGKAEPVHQTERSSRLTRSRANRKLLGVCAGLAAYINVDATVVRILFIVGGLVSLGFMILLYILMAIVVPSDEQQPVHAVA